MKLGHDHISSLPLNKNCYRGIDILARKLASFIDHCIKTKTFLVFTEKKTVRDVL